MLQILCGYEEESEEEVKDEEEVTTTTKNDAGFYENDLTRP